MVKVEAYQRLSFLYYCLESLKERPGIADPEVRPAAEDFLNGCIADLEQDLFGQKEKAADQGDIFSGTNVISVAFSIPSMGSVDKEVATYD